MLLLAELLLYPVPWYLAILRLDTQQVKEQIRRAYAAWTVSGIL